MAFACYKKKLMAIRTQGMLFICSSRPGRIIYHIDITLLYIQFLIILLKFFTEFIFAKAKLPP